VQVAEQMIDL